MASGFVQRFKGKIKASVAWIDTANITTLNISTASGAAVIAGHVLYGAGAIQNLSLISSSLGASTIGSTASFVNLLSSASTTQSIVRIPAPTFAGEAIVIQTSTSMGYILTASTAGAVTFNGSSLTAAASTGGAPYVLSLEATSTANWAIVGAYPGIYTSTGGTIWALSTST